MMFSETDAYFIVANETYNYTYYDYNGSLYDIYVYPSEEDSVDYSIRVFVEVIIVLLSLIGNSLIIITLACGKIGFTSTHILFISLAVSDSLLAMSGVGFGLVERYMTISFEITCKIAVIPKTVLCLSSNTLALITIERVLCVTIPHKVKRVCNKKLALVQLLVLWVFFALYFAFHFEYTGFATWDSHKWCGFILMPNVLKNEALEQLYIIFNSALTFVFPFATTFIGTIIILFKLKNRMQSYSKQSVATTFILINTNVVFVLTKLPFSIWQYLGLDVVTSLPEMTTYYLHSVISYLSLISCALNFFVYFLSGRYFRQAVMKMFKDCFSKA